FVQLRSSFLIAPVADPDQIALFRYVPAWLKQRRVRRLVPGEHARRQCALEINLAQRFAEHERAVKSIQQVRRDLIRGGDGAMMRVMKQQLERAGTLAPLTESFEQPARIPLVRHDHASVNKDAVE